MLLETLLLLPILSGILANPFPTSEFTLCEPAPNLKYYQGYNCPEPSVFNKTLTPRICTEVLAMGIKSESIPAELCIFHFFHSSVDCSGGPGAIATAYNLHEVGESCLPVNIVRSGKYVNESRILSCWSVVLTKSYPHHSSIGDFQSSSPYININSKSNYKLKSQTLKSARFSQVNQNSINMLFIILLPLTLTLLASALVTP